MSDATIIIRDGNADDEALVYATWLRSYRHSPFARNIRSRDYFANQHRVISEILARKDTRVVCAALASDPIVCVGWMVAEPERNLAHYVYTKKSWEGQGIARRLLDAIPSYPDTLVYSHRTHGQDGRVDRILRQHGGHWLYNPYEAFS